MYVERKSKGEFYQAKISIGSGSGFSLRSDPNLSRATNPDKSHPDPQP